MHEQSLAKALWQQVVAIAQANAAQRVKEVRVVVGEFSGVEPELLVSAFAREAARGSAHGVVCRTQLSVQYSPLVARCGDCSLEFQVRDFSLICSACHGRNVAITQGEELLLDSVILETEE